LQLKRPSVFVNYSLKGFGVRISEELDGIFYKLREHKSIMRGSIMQAFSELFSMKNYDTPDSVVN